MIPTHWHFLNLGRGVNSTGPGLAEFFMDEIELGARVVLYLEDEELGLWPLMGYFDA